MAGNHFLGLKNILYVSGKSDCTPRFIDFDSARKLHWICLNVRPRQLDAAILDTLSEDHWATTGVRNRSALKVFEVSFGARESALTGSSHPRWKCAFALPLPLKSCICASSLGSPVTFTCNPGFLGKSLVLSCAPFYAGAVRRGVRPEMFPAQLPEPRHTMRTNTSSPRPLSTSLSRFRTSLAIAAVLSVGAASKAGGINPNGGISIGTLGTGTLNTSLSLELAGVTTGIVPINTGAQASANSIVFKAGKATVASRTKADLKKLARANPTLTVAGTLGNTITVALPPDESNLTIGGAGTLVKTGAGSLQLTGTGTTTLGGGVLDFGREPLGVTLGGTLVVSRPTISYPIAGMGGLTYSGSITVSNVLGVLETGATRYAVAGDMTLSDPSVGGGLLLTGNYPTLGAGTILTRINPGFGAVLQQAPPTVFTVGFGTGGVTTLPSGDLTLTGGGRFTIAPSIGTGLTTTAGISGRWISTGSNAIQNTFATPWFTVPTVTTRIEAIIDNPNSAGINTANGLPGGFTGYVGIPQGVGLAATSAFVDSYAVIYNGILAITTGGSYTFTMPSDDGGSVFIDGQQVLANEGGHGTGTIGTGTVTLAAGPHQITVKNTNGGTGGGVQLAYQGPDQPTAPVLGTVNGSPGYTNMATVGVKALTNVTGGLNYALTNNIVVPDQVGPTNTVFETSGFDTTSSGTITAGVNGNLVFASATSNTFTQNGGVTLAAGSGLASIGTAVTAPVTTTLAPANVIVNGTITLAGNASLNADGGVINSPIGLVTVNGVITDGAGTFGITKNGGGGIVTLAGTAANTFDGAFNVAQGVLQLNKPAGVNAIGVGGLNLDTSIATGAAAIDYAVVRLLANEQIDDTSTLNVLTHNTVGYGATFNLNGFTETVGAVNVRGATTNMGRIVTGQNGKLIVGGNITMSNNRNATGNTGREALITGVASASNALNLFQPGTGTLDLNNATRTITTDSTVTQLATDGTIDTVIINGGIIKAGGQRLVLNGSNPNLGFNSTFAGGIVLNDGVLRGGGAGARTDSAFGTGTLTINKGLTTAAGGIVAGLATVELRNNGAGVNTVQGGTVGGYSIGQAVANTITYGNAVNIAAAVPIAAFDVNNYVQLQNGATLTGSGGTMVMGTLTTNGAAEVDVTGGNNYALRFNGLALGGALTVKPTSGNLQLNNLGTAGANNIISAAGTTGSLIVGGNGAGYTGTINLTAGGTLRLAPAVGVVNNQLGGATLTVAPTTLGIMPTLEGGSISGVGAIQGGLISKFYQTNAAQNINTSVAYNQIPSGVLNIPLLSDAAVSNRPPTVTGTSFTNDILVATGLLNITAAGSYTFQTFVDDQSQLVIDGIPLVSVNTGAGGTGIIHSPVSAPITLSAGFHTITMKVSNQGGGGGYAVLYNGADSGGVMRPIPSSALYRPAAYSNVANTGINQTIAAGATFTLDGGGTDLDGGINDLTFSGATGTLTVTNGGSSVASPNGSGTITVSGVTSFGANAPTFNPTTAVLALLGDVTGSGTITKSGAGLLVLAGAKTFTGPLNLTVGGLQITDPNSLGTAAGATTVSAGAVLDLNGVALAAEPLTLSGTGIANVTPGALWNSSGSAASVSGPITLAAATTIGGLGDITLSGGISGNQALTKIGPNTLNITGANTSTAAITVSTGFLKVGNANALGTTATNTVVSAGAVLDLNGFSLAEPLTINGAGVTNYGSMNSLAALINSGATVTHTGAISLGAASTIGSSSLAVGGDIIITGVISGAQALTKAGGNTLTLSGVNTYTQATTVNFGTLLVNGTGSIATQASLTVNPTATVTYDYSGATTAKNGAHNITLVGGNLNLLGNAAAVTEAIAGGILQANSNHSVVTLSPTATGALALTSTANLARANNGTVLIRGTGLGSAPGAGIAQVTFGGSAQTIGQFGAAGSKNRAIIPWAFMDTTTTGDGSSFVNIGANGVQALNPASEYDVDTITGPNNVLAAATNISVPAGNVLINSLTLTAAGAVTIGPGSVLRLDSGAIGSNATTTITGELNGGIAQSNQLRELIVYTSGAGTNLTVGTLGSNITGINAIGPNASPNLGGVGAIIRGGLTKAGLGTLTISASGKYVGTTRLNGGTTVLKAGTNSIFFPALTAPAPGSLVSTLNSQNLVVNAGATLDLNGTQQRFGGFASNLAAGSSALPGQGGIITNNSTTSDATIYFSQGATFTVPTSITQSAVAGAMKTNLVREGGFTLTLTAPQTYTGTTTFNGGLTILQDGATLSGTSSITVNRSALRIDDSQTIQTLNRIPVTTPITLKGGSLAFVGRGGGTQNAWSVGTVNIGLGNALFQATMAANANANGAGNAQLTIGNIVRAGAGSQVSFNFIQSNAQSVGDNPRYFISQLNGAALPAPGVMLPAWITVGGQNPASAAGGTSGTINNIQANTTDFAQYDPATGLRPILYTSVLAPGNNVNLGATTTLPVGNTLVNSLRLDNASTLIFGDAGFDTLNIQSGGLLSSLNANNRNVGITANAGNLTAGGLTPAAATELFIYNGANTLTVHARIIDNPNGPGSVISPVYSSGGFGSTIQVTGSNTYTGTTFVNGVNMTLNNTVGGLSVPGNLIISGNTSNGGDSQNPANQTVTLAASNQIAPTATVTLNGGTVLSLGTSSQTLANLVFNADGGSFNNQGPAVQTGTGVLTLTGDVTATSLLHGTTIPVMQGNLALPAGAHNFNIGTFQAAPGQTGLALNSVLSGAGSIDKSGPGALGLGGNSPGYLGPINVNAGSVMFTGNNMSVGSLITLAAGTILNAGGFIGNVGALAGTGTVTSTFSTLDQVGGQVNVGVNNTTSSFGGLVTGVVAMGKVGTAGFTLTNPLNDYSGGTLVNGGTLTLAGAGINTTGSGAVTVNNTGNLAGSGLVNGGLVFNPGSSASFALPASPGAALISTGTSSVTSLGPATFNFTGTPAPGVYPLIDYGGTAVSANALAGIKVGATPGGGSLFGLLHNAAGTSINLSVETVRSAQTWTGAVNGTWDTATGNWGGVYVDTNQVVFGDSGNNRTIAGGVVNPQAITVNNSAGKDYSISNVIGGALAGGLTKSGNGVLQLTGANTFGGGSITINGGTLRAAVSSGLSSLGSAPVALGNGATLQLDPTANTSTQGITGRYFHQTNNSSGLGQALFALPAVATQTDPGVNITWTPANRPANAAVGSINGGNWESFGAQWIGKVNIPAAGPWSFFTNSDDATRVFIDGVLVNNLDGGKGNTESGGVITLSQGLHDVRFEFLQSTGGAQAGLSWQGPGVAKQVIPAASLFTAENIANGFADNNILVGTNVSVAGTSTINLNGRAFTAVQLGGLTIPGGSTLNVTSEPGKQLRAGATFLSGGTVTLNASADLNLGQILDGGTATTIVKQGNGRLVLDNTSPVGTGRANNFVNGTVFDVQGGKLVAMGIASGALTLNSNNPLGGAQVRLNGGNLQLDTKLGSVTFDNPISVLQNAVIEAVPNNNTVVNTIVTLGGTNGIAVSGGSTLTLDAFGGARAGGNAPNTVLATSNAGNALTVAGVISGTGNLAFRSTQLNQEQYPVYGTFTLNANNSIAGTATLNGGYAFQNVANPLIVTLNGNGRLSGNTGITINAAQLTLDDGATVNTGRINATTAAPVTLRAGSFHVLAAAGAASGETLGTVTSDAGYNRIIIQNSPNNNITAAIVGSSLVRNNRSAVQFQGNRLGLAADANNPSTQIRFTTAPGLLGGGTAAGTATISILPFGAGAQNPATNPPTYFPVTYDAVTGIRPLVVAETTAIGVAAISGNARDSFGAAGAPVPSVNQINSWTVDNSAATAQTVTLTSNSVVFKDDGAGLLLITASNATQSALTIAGTAINFGVAEGHIFVTNTAGATISSTLLGNSGLTISGNNNINNNNLQQLTGGSLTLTGDNSATLFGSIVINGRLVLNSGTGDTPLGEASNAVQFGGGTLVFNNAGTTLASTRTVTMFGNSFGVIDTNGNANTIAGQVTGAGGLVKIGTGTLTLNNTTNNYSGPTTIFAGNLVTSTGPQGNLVISGNGSNVNFTQSTSGTYAGNITGIGSLTINNTTSAPITITLGDPTNANVGVNAYGGGTTFANTNAVTLRGTTSSLVGAIVTQANDAIVYEQNFDGTSGALISGPAPFTKLGTGKVTLVNANTYTGLTTIAGGTLSISAPNQIGDASGTNSIAISGGATLQATASFNLGATRTIGLGSGGGRVDVTANPTPNTPNTVVVSGAITGAAGDGLTKLGPGILTLAATNTYAGGTTVSEGTLLVNGSVVSPTAVNGITAILGGSGTTGDITVTGGGTVAPGNSPGVLTANGNVSFAAGTNLSIELRHLAGAPVAGTDYDQLRVTGAASTIDLGGSTLSLAIGSPLSTGDLFTLILNDTSDANTGAFAGLANNTEFVSGGFMFRISYFDDAATPGLEVAGGNDVSILVTVPEPGSLSVLAAAGAMAMGLRRFRRRQN